MQEFLRAGRPVIQVLNIKDLSARYGLPYDPVAVAGIGRSGVYRPGASRILGTGLEWGLGWGLGLRLGVLALVFLPVIGVMAAYALYRRRFRLVGR